MNFAEDNYVVSRLPRLWVLFQGEERMPNENQEQNDDELRWRLETLKVMFDEGKLHIAEHLWHDTKVSLSKVQYGSNGKIDLSTVDSRIRAMSLVSAHVRQREEAKDAISLSDISSMYFEIIEKNLGFINKEANDRDLMHCSSPDLPLKTPNL